MVGEYRVKCGQNFQSKKENGQNYTSKWYLNFLQIDQYKFYQPINLKFEIKLLLDNTILLTLDVLGKI